MIIHQNIVATINMLLTFVLMYILSNFTLMHFVTTQRKRERDEDRSISSSHKMKQNREYMALFFPDFCRSFVVKKFLCYISFSCDNANTRKRWGT